MNALLFSLSSSRVGALVLFLALALIASGQSIDDIKEGLDNDSVSLTDGTGFLLQSDPLRVDGDYVQVDAYDEGNLSNQGAFTRYSLQIDVEGPATVSFEYYLSSLYGAGSVGILIQGELSGGDNPQPIGGVVGITDFEDLSETGPDAAWAGLTMQIPNGGYRIFIVVDQNFPINGNSLDFRLDNLEVLELGAELEPAQYYYASDSISNPIIETYDVGPIEFMASSFLGIHEIQWFKDDVEIDGASAETLFIADAMDGDDGDSGLYSFELTNGTGSSRLGFRQILVVDPIAISALVSEALDPTDGIDPLDLEFSDGARFELIDDGEGGDYLAAPPFLDTAENSFDLSFEVIGPAIVSYDYLALDPNANKDSDVEIDGVLTDFDGNVIADFGFYSDSSVDSNDTEGWVTHSYRIPSGTYQFRWDVDLDPVEDGEAEGDQRWDNLVITPDTQSEDPLDYFYNYSGNTERFTIAQGTPFNYEAELLGDFELQWYFDSTPDDGVDASTPIVGATSRKLEVNPAALEQSGIYTLAITELDQTTFVEVFRLDVLLFGNDSVGNREDAATDLGEPEYVALDPEPDFEATPEASRGFQYFGDFDYFAFTLANRSVVDIYTEGNADSAGILYKDNVEIDRSLGGGVLANFSMSDLDLEAGVYILAVSSASDRKLGPYNLFIEPVAFDSITFPAGTTLIGGTFLDGENIVFTVEPESVPPVNTYVWTFDNDPLDPENEVVTLEGASGKSLLIPNVSADDAGLYTVTVSAVYDDEIVFESTQSGELTVTHKITLIPQNGSVEVAEVIGENKDLLTGSKLEAITSGSTIEFTAIPDDGYYFIGWGSLSDSTDPTITTTLGESVTVEPEFGTIEVISNDIAGSYFDGESATLSVEIQVTPAITSYSWAFDSDSEDPDNELVLLEDVLNPEIELNSSSLTLSPVGSGAAGIYYLTAANAYDSITVSGELLVLNDLSVVSENGTVSVVDGGGSSLDEGSLATISTGSKITLTANAADGYYFSEWKTSVFPPDLDISSQSITIEVQDSGEITAVFLPIPQIEITASMIGGIILEGQTVTFSVTATSDAPLTYSWYYKGSGTDEFVLQELINQPSWSIDNASPGISGEYQVVIDNGFVSEKVTGQLLIEKIELGRDAFSKVTVIGFSDEEESQPGWVYVDWFGLFEVSQAPWIYHEPIGWIVVEDDTNYPAESSGIDADSVWVWLPGLSEWYLFSEYDNPWVWSDQEQAWNYRYEDGVSVWIYSYSEEVWKLASTQTE